MELDTSVALCRLPGFQSLLHPVSPTVGCQNPSSRYFSRKHKITRAMRSHIAISQLVNMTESAPAATPAPGAAPSADAAAPAQQR
ncbi:hypothetical protein ON010_g18506 [Phytophthora cinnamomi]|nr:hypothetical protein ON010_g18506 [Phytophthora cinnamomi]